MPCSWKFSILPSGEPIVCDWKKNQISKNLFFNKWVRKKSNNQHRSLFLATRNFTFKTKIIFLRPRRRRRDRANMCEPFKLPLEYHQGMEFKKQTPREKKATGVLSSSSLRKGASRTRCKVPVQRQSCRNRWWIIPDAFAHCLDRVP